MKHTPSILDRTQPPPIRPVTEVRWSAPRRYPLPGGASCYALADPALEAFRLDILFPQGTWHEPRPLAAEATIHNLQEGTRRKDAATIAGTFEYYGSYLMPFSHLDHTGLSLYALRRHAAPLLELLAEILTEARFPEEEFRTWLAQERQAFLIESEKVSYLSLAAFRELIFGADHPYGRRRREEDYLQLQRTDLTTWHREQLLAGERILILAGSSDEELLTSFKILAPSGAGAAPGEEGFPAPPPYAGKELFIEKKNAVQAAITMGRRIINRNHPDYPALAFTITLLGGYFGSRLMKNIREEKGYTYGISASLRPLRHDAYLTIQTEAGSEVCRDTIEEIRKEIRRLMDDPPPAEEMMLVRNYMMGNLLQSLDGVLARGEMVRRLLSAHAPLDHVERFSRALRKVTPEQVSEMARRWLDPGTMALVVAGKCKG